MKLKQLSRQLLVATSLLYSLASAANVETQTLATVGPLQVTASDLDRAVASSPFATQFVTMDEPAQASLRGDLLRRLVNARLFLLEADRLKLRDTPEFKHDSQTFRDGLLYRKYLTHLRGLIQIPPDELAGMAETYRESPDALSAAKSAYISSRYKALKLETLRRLRDRWHVQLHEDRLALDAPDDTLLMEGDGLRVTLADLAYDDSGKRATNLEWVRDQLYQKAEVLLLAKAAAEQGEDVSTQLSSYEQEHLPAMLLERKVSEWIPDQQVLRDYYREHMDLGHIDGRLHIGMLVVRTRGEAEALRKRILAGESLFELAGKYSIDPYGRSRNGDIGWVSEGKALPQIKKALDGLPDDQVSEVVETEKGFHLFTILGRRVGTQKLFVEIPDRVRQAYISERLRGYVGELSRKYQVVWNVLDDSKDK